MDDPTRWECLGCARVIDATVDDYCPNCGKATPELNVPIPLREALPVLYGMLLSILGGALICHLAGWR